MNSSRPIRSIVIFLIFVVGCIFLLSLVFGGGNKSGNSSKNSVKKSFSLLDYVDTESRVVATTNGRIVGDDEHRAVRITVTRSSRKVEIIQGFQGNVIDSKEYSNNSDAYKQFLAALSKTSFGKVRKGEFGTETGVCASGRRYVFEVFDKNKSVSRTWTASCAKGSSLASPEAVTNLFRRQITDYGQITTGVTF